ncbi:MAG: ComF family protein [Patescibacteria group bacterium]
MLSFPKLILASLFDILYPNRCINCGHYGQLLCLECASDLEILKSYTCYGCGKLSQFGKLCNNCKKQLGGNIDSIIYAVDYSSKIAKTLISAFKYSGITELSTTLSALLITRIPSLEPGIIMPVPLHPSKKLRRGFNQSELLAKEISKKLGFPLNNYLVRVKNTQSQVGLSRAKRLQNLEQAFVCRNSWRIKGKVVYLVDDVVTTGSTFAACASVLKEAGAKKVVCLAIARNLHMK